MKCKVCGHEFKLRKKNKYIVEKTEHQLLGGAFTTFHDCFDCPACGCQNKVNEHIENISVNYSPVGKTAAINKINNITEGDDQ